MSYYTLVFPGAPDTVPRDAPQSKRLMSLTFQRAVEAYLIEWGEPSCLLVRGGPYDGALHRELVFTLNDAAILRMVERQLERASKTSKAKKKKLKRR